MQEVKSILLASHGSDGACAAEQRALEYCSAGVTLLHLVVVPEFWEGMTGDDWLNNGEVRNTFRRYLESELEKEVEENLVRVQEAVEATSAIYQYVLRQGKPDQCLLDVVAEADADRLIMGGLRPKKVTGLKSRMLTDKLLRELDIEMDIIPWPKAQAS